MAEAWTDGPLLRAVVGEPTLPNDNGRLVSYRLSDQSVARDGHTIATNGWQLASFRANPVFLWAHDTGMPPIGRLVDISAQGNELRGTVEYIGPDVSPFADMIFRMVKGGFLNAVSVSWAPLKWKYSTDKNRPGGIDFLEQDLLEVSQVPVPAAPTALATARAAGIDLAPMVEWAERILDSGDRILIPRTELEALRRDAKMATAPKKTVTVAKPKRGLGAVAWLAYLLQDLGYIEESTEWEAEMEGDNSPIPGRLTDALNTLGQILKDMTVEEVDELLAEEVEEPAPADDVYMAGAKNPAQKALRGLIVAGRRSRAESQTVTVTVDSKDIAAELHRISTEVAAHVRSGRVLSADNERCLRDAHDMMTRGCDMVRGVFEQVDPEETDETTPDDEENEREAKLARERRARKAKALKHTQA